MLGYLLCTGGFALTASRIRGRLGKRKIEHAKKAQCSWPLRVALQDCFVALAAVENADDENLLGVCVDGNHGTFLVVRRRLETGQAFVVVLRRQISLTIGADWLGRVSFGSYCMHNKLLPFTKIPQ